MLVLYGVHDGVRRVRDLRGRVRGVLSGRDVSRPGDHHDGRNRDACVVLTGGETSSLSTEQRSGTG